MNSKYKVAKSLTSSSDEQSNRPERHKYLFELTKHMTTLSSGSVLLLVTFLEKVLNGKPPGLFVMVSFGGFCISTLGSLGLMLVLASSFGEKIPEEDRTYFTVVSMMAISGFMTGILFLMAAAYRSY